MAFGFKAVEGALEVGLPGARVLELGDDHGAGEDAVLPGVAAGDGLSGWGVGSAFGYGSPRNG